MRSKTRAKRKSKQESQEIVGRLTTLDPTLSRIEVEDERSPRKVWIDMKKARLRNLVDGDGDGQASLTDLFPGDRVRVMTATATEGGMRAKILWRIGPQGPPGGLSPISTGLKSS